MLRHQYLKRNLSVDRQMKLGKMRRTERRSEGFQSAPRRCFRQMAGQGGSMSSTLVLCPAMRSQPSFHLSRSAESRYHEAPSISEIVNSAYLLELEHWCYFRCRAKGNAETHVRKSNMIDITKYHCFDLKSTPISINVTRGQILHQSILMYPCRSSDCNC